MTKNFGVRFVTFAFIVPVYEVQKYLADCLESILAQTYPHFIVVAVDDGSTDCSGEILDHYELKDPRIRVLHKANGGVSSARNAGLDIVESESKVDYVCFIDSDDKISPVFLETFINNVSLYHADYAVCAYDRFDINGIIRSNELGSSKPYCLNQEEIENQFFRNEKIGRNCRDKTVAHFLNNKLFSLEAIRGIRFDDSYDRAEDCDFFLKCLPRLQCGVLVPNVLFFYRQRKTSLSHDQSVQEKKLRILFNYFKLKINGAYKNGLVDYLVDSLWSVNKLIYEGEARECNKNDVLAILKDIKNYHVFNLCSSKNKRRLLMLMAGDGFLKMYFSFRGKLLPGRANKKEDNYFE